MKFEYKFEHHWGGEDNWYTKSKRWAKKQPFPLSHLITCLLYTSPSPRDVEESRMPSSA